MSTATVITVSVRMASDWPAVATEGGVEEGTGGSEEGVEDRYRYDY